MSSYHESYSTASSSIGKHRNLEFPTNSLADVTSGLAFNQEYSLKFIYVVQGIPICLLGIPFNIPFKSNSDKSKQSSQELISTALNLIS